MPRIARKNLIGNYFHIMVQGLNKEYIFIKNQDKEKYKSILKEYINDYNIEIIAYCIMDNHVHLLIYTKESKQMSLWMHHVNTKYAIYYNHKYNHVGYVFRNRFHNQEIRDVDHLKKCIVYIHRNPVKAKIVSNIAHYKYSSYNEYLDKQYLISKKIVLSLFNEDKWKEYFLLLHKQEPDEKFIEIKEDIDYNEIINLYKKKNLTNKEITIELKENYNLSQRKIADLLKIGRHYVRKYLK